MDATKFKFLTALFSLTCLYLVAAPEAKAQCSLSKTQLEKSSPCLQSDGRPDKLASFGAIVAPSLFELVTPLSFDSEFALNIFTPPSKYFSIRSGLSPPVLFV